MTTEQTITLSAGADTAVISTFGANLWSWRVAGQDVIDGYRDTAEAHARVGLRSGVMAPWSNRIRGAKYHWQGADYAFTVDQHPSPLAIHGLVDRVVWRIVEQSETYLSLRCDVAGIPAYPWPLQISAHYQLSAGGKLRFTLGAKNVSEKVAPVGLGWHPYFILGQVSQVEVDLPALASVNVDEKLLPIDQERAFSDFTGPLQVGDKEIDRAYTHLEDRPLRATGPAGNLTMDANLATGRDGVGIWHLFTGDTLSVRRREAVAIEPCLFQTDAFNRAALAEDLALNPGQERTLDVHLSFQKA